MKNKLTYLFLFTLILGSTGCVIEESVGPEGPQGPPGNANVFTLNFDFLMADAVVNGAVASVQFDASDITANVVDEGAVLMFFRDQGTWTAMPYTFGVESQDLPAVDYTISLGFGYEFGFLEVFYEASTDAVDLFGLPDREMKAVIIDGFYFGKTELDLTNWEEVKAAFDLTD